MGKRRYKYKGKKSDPKQTFLLIIIMSAILVAAASLSIPPQQSLSGQFEGPPGGGGGGGISIPIRNIQPAPPVIIPAPVPGTTTSDFCGNCKAEVGESCDDGNTASNDGCNSECKLEYCGNGYVEGLEQCDREVTDNRFCAHDCTWSSFSNGRPPLVRSLGPTQHIIQSGTASFLISINDPDQDLIGYEICTGGISTVSCGGGSGGYGCVRPLVTFPATGHFSQIVTVPYGPVQVTQTYRYHVNAFDQAGHKTGATGLVVVHP